MLYPKLKFPKVSGRPFFYTNFVQTLDGKVAVVKKSGYWPMGSRVDHDLLVELRAHADCLIHGGNLAKQFGKVTLKSLQDPKFEAFRKKLGKSPNLPYYIMSRHSNFTHSMCQVTNLRPKDLAKELYRKEYKNVLVEGGPTLLGSFLKENLIDEIFLTISPKIYGTYPGKTLTLVEGILFKPKQIKKFKLTSVKKVGNEVFLRLEAM